MKTKALLLAMALCVAGCSAQTEEKSTDEKSTIDEKTTKIDIEHSQPNEKWIVHKEVDEDGNIVKYDSTYTWSYTNLEGDSMHVDVDSVMNTFSMFLDEKEDTIWNSIWDDKVSRLHYSDSLFFPDFLMDDYFFNLWENDHLQTRELFHRMDSIRNHYFRQHYPGLLFPPKTDEK